MKFEQITTKVRYQRTIENWWFYRKGSEIWANHNGKETYVERHTIGDSTAKVVKFEQITTNGQIIRPQRRLVILPQR